MACRYRGRVWENSWCNVACRYCTLDQELSCEHNHQTGIEWIRGLSERELAEFLASKFTEFVRIQATDNGQGMTATQLHVVKETWFRAWMQWLRAPVEEGKETKDGSAQTRNG